MPFISVICPTVRVGGLDILFDSLKAQTFTDFELVLVDGLYEKRKEMVQEEARDRFLAVRHVGLSPQPSYCSFCLMSNAGIMASTGDVLLFIVDYSRLPPDLIGQHALFHKLDPTGRGGLMGPHQYIALEVNPEFPRYTSDEIDRYESDIKSGALDRFMWKIGWSLDVPSAPHHADGNVMVPHDCDPKLRLKPGPVSPTFFHAKNESVRRDRVIEVDGYDQDLDGAHLYQDSDFADRLTVKAGVQWMVHPGMVIDIINPRHVFPFSRRTRDYKENERIWRTKKAAGYPSDGNQLKSQILIKEVDVAPLVITKKENPLRVAMIYGEFCKPGAPFDLPGLYRTQMLTGSEISFFNTAIGLSELGHDVLAICKCEKEYHHPSGLTVMPLPALGNLPREKNVDAVMAWNEPDYLVFAPADAAKICYQQLNDWAYCHEPGWSERCDVWVFPSHEALGWHVTEGGLGKQYPTRTDAKFRAIPSSCSPEHYLGNIQRVPHRAIWASSPDRGLHHLLEMWPDIRKRVNDAELRIFYEVRSLIERCKNHTDEVGKRARFMAEALPRLEQHGVTVVGPVDAHTMARELQAATVMPFTCNPPRHTEMFAGAVLDACAGGCLPIVTDRDCVPSVHGFASIVIPGDPEKNRSRWIDEICRVMQEGASPMDVMAMKKHAQNHAKQKVTAQWEALLEELAS